MLAVEVRVLETTVAAEGTTGVTLLVFATDKVDWDELLLGNTLAATEWCWFGCIGGTD